jgi:hypothetical protein
MPEINIAKQEDSAKAIILSKVNSMDKGIYGVDSINRVMRTTRKTYLLRAKQGHPWYF